MASAQEYQGNSSQDFFLKQPIQDLASLLTLFKLLLDKYRQFLLNFIKSNCIKKSRFTQNER